MIGICWRRDSGKSGFTLVEVLVVVAIVGILAAIVFPVLASARRSGQKAVCLSNMRQIVQAQLIYASDQDELLARTNPFEPYESWLHKLGLEHGLIPTLACPSRDKAPSDVPNPRIEAELSGYAFNECPLKLSDAEVPSQTVLVSERLCEIDPESPGPDHIVCYDHAPSPDSVIAHYRNLVRPPDRQIRPYGAWGSERHSGRANYALADGSCKSLTASQIRIPEPPHNPCNVDSPTWVGPASGPQFAAYHLGPNR